MARYARIEDGVVAEVYETDQDIYSLFHPDMQWIRIADDSPVGERYLYDGKKFSPPRANQRAVTLEMLVSAINGWRDAQEAAGVKFEFNGAYFDGGNRSRLRLQDSITADAGAIPGFFWTSEANENVEMTTEDLRGLYQAMIAARVEEGFRIHTRQREMKDEVATLTAEERANYAIGWPE